MSTALLCSIYIRVSGDDMLLFGYEMSNFSCRTEGS